MCHCTAPGESIHIGYNVNGALLELNNMVTLFSSVSFSGNSTSKIVQAKHLAVKNMKN